MDQVEVDEEVVEHVTQSVLVEYADDDTVEVVELNDEELQHVEVDDEVVEVQVQTLIVVMDDIEPLDYLLLDILLHADMISLEDVNTHAETIQSIVSILMVL